MIEVICDQCERVNKQNAENCDRCGAALVEREVASANETLPPVTPGEVTPDESSSTSVPALESTIEEASINSGKADESHELLASAITGTSIGNRLVPVVIAALLTIALQYYVANNANSASFLHNLLLPPGDWLQKTIPIAIVFLFFWSLGRLVMKFVTIQKELGYLAGEAVQSCPRSVAEDQLAAAHESIRNETEKNSKSFVYRTVNSLLDHLTLTKDPQRSHEFLRHQSDLESDAVQSSDNTGKVFIWSMAILGFIGTVVGASLGVGEFSGFLAADIEDIALLNNQLGKMATELSFAFNTILLGLLASLIVMLATSFVQRCEGGLHKDVGDLCLRVVSHAKVAEPNRSLEGHVETWFAELKEVLDSEASQRQAVFDAIATNVIQVGDEVSGSVSMLEVGLGNIKTVFIGELENSFREITSDIQRVGQDIADASENFPIHITKAQNSFAGEIDGALANVASRFEGVGDQISGSYASLPETLDNVQNQFANELKAQIESQVEGLKNFGAAFNASVTTLSSSLTDMPAQLANAGQALESSAAQVAQLKASIDAAADSSADQTSSAQLLAQKVETLAISSEVTQQAVSSLQSLKSLLSELQHSQAKIAPLLDQLAGPHEIRIVPGQGLVAESDVAEPA